MEFTLHAVFFMAFFFILAIDDLNWVGIAVGSVVIGL
jgi:hypothetical protein